MDLSPAQRDALILAERRQRQLVRARIEQYATTVWNGLGSWRDADIDRLVALVLPKVIAGQRTVSNLTDTYLASITGLRPVGVINVDSGLRGVDPAEVYRRPAVEMRTALSTGSSMTDALKAGALRLVSLVSTDMQLANVRQAQAFNSTREVDAYRRIAGGAHPCALCLIASTQRYHRAELMPIHPGCSCTVESLGVGDHREQVLDKVELERVHAAVESLTGGFDRSARDLGAGNPVSDYLDLIEVRRNGELGPVLTWRGQHFTGPAQIAA